LAARQSAPAQFNTIDISRTAGDGQAAQQAANDVCNPGLGATELERLRKISESAEKQFFNPAIANAADTTTKNAIQCQKDRNKVLKNTCQLMKAQLQNDQSQIAENTRQLAKNTGDVTNRCANVDTSLFISSGGSGVGTGNGNSNAGGNNNRNNNSNNNRNNNNQNNNAGGAAGGNGNGNTSVVPISFAAVDISKKAGNALTNAQSICPSTDSPALIESKRRAAEDAEKRIFNTALRAAGNDTDKKAAIQCQKDRNKVLKNHCQLVKAQLQNDQAQIAENTKQLTKNTADAASRCQGVDTSLFISN
jgi:DNA-binding transcriptional MerR regulator